MGGKKNLLIMFKNALLWLSHTHALLSLCPATNPRLNQKGVFIFAVIVNASDTDRQSPVVCYMCERTTLDTTSEFI